MMLMMMMMHESDTFKHMTSNIKHHERSQLLHGAWGQASLMSLTRVSAYAQVATYLTCTRLERYLQSTYLPPEHAAESAVVALADLKDMEIAFRQH